MAVTFRSKVDAWLYVVMAIMICILLFIAWRILQERVPGLWVLASSPALSFDRLRITYGPGKDLMRPTRRSPAGIARSGRSPWASSPWNWPRSRASPCGPT